MKKKVTYFFTLIIGLILLSLSQKNVYAEESYGEVVDSGSCGQNATYVLYDSGTLVISGSGRMYREAFFDNQNIKTIKKVIINEGITNVGECAFDDCSSLTEIVLPTGMTDIDPWAFRGCSSLTEIILPEEVTIIGVDAFIGCSSLESIELPIGMTTICEWAFGGCSSLTNIALPEGLTRIGKCAFSGCSSLTGIEVDSNNEYYSSIDGVLYNKDITELVMCPDVKDKINIPDSVTSIGDYAFYDCKNLTGIELPEGITSIGDYAFYGCSSLTSIELPKGLTSIGDYAFEDCSSLTSIELPKGLTSIGDYAFEDCSSLTSIELPEEITSIGNRVFNNCSNLTSIEVDSNNEYYSSIEGVLYNKDITELIICPVRKDKIAIPDSVTSIYDYAFYYCSNLTSINLPEGIKSIGNSAFYHCSSLTSINLPIGITSIGDSALLECRSLVAYGYSDSYAESYTKENNIPFVALDKEQEYGDVLCGGICGANAMYLLYDSGTLVISGSGWTYRNAFHNNQDIKNVIINEGITEIGEDAFGGCSSLTSIELPSGITSIDDYLFYGCSSLESINIPDSIADIGYDVFYGCINLNSIEVDDNNEYYSSIEGVLYDKDIKTLINCPGGKENINIPDSVISIGARAFNGCENLTSVILHEGITEIGEGAFWGCWNLIINCYPDSCAENYAKENNIQYKLIIEAGWKQDANGWRYVNVDGTCPMNTWETIDGNKYFFNESGYMVTGWLNYNGNWYYLESSGKLATDKWIEGIYYVKSDGVMATNEWVDGDNYYVGEDGKWIPDKMDKVTVILKWDKANAVNAWCWGDKLIYTESQCWPGDAMINIDDSIWKITIPTKEPDNYVGFLANYWIGGDSVRTLDLQIPNSGNVFIIVDEEPDPDTNWIYGATVCKYEILDDQTVIIQKCWGEASDIIIPDEIDGYEVKSISDGAFYGCENIKSITIPKSVTKMESGVFDGCTSLTINCYSGSYAETYAKGNQIPYKLLDAPKACWKKDVIGWWYDNGDGSYPKSEWKSIDGSWYYFKASGYMAANEWVDGGKYYVDSNGKWIPNKTKSSWKKDVKGWWYDNGDGTYPKSAWKSIDGSWYYFNNSGYMVTGWLNDGGKWYYLESSGRMASSKWIDGTYYVKANGVMAVSEWVDNGRYYVDSNGKWVA